MIPRIIAHRCGGALAPENSLAGLQIAARLGCRGVEFDVMLSADGVPLLIHDESLERTTNGRGRVCDFTAGEIRALDAGAGHHAAFAVSPPPTLEEALSRCAALGLWTNIELKPSKGCEHDTGRIVGEHLARHWNGRGVVSSFSASALAAARSVSSALPLACLFEELPDGWQDMAARIGAARIHLSADGATAEAAAALAGIAWAAYTVNRRDAADLLFARGAAAVFTDRPDLWLPGEM